MTKRDVGYRLSAECCNTCQYVQKHMYDNPTCAHLSERIEVDLGAVCDYYNRKETAVKEFKEQEGTCMTCQYSYADSDGPRCSVDMELIKDPTKGCEAFMEVKPWQ